MNCAPTEPPPADSLDIDALRDRYRSERDKRTRVEGQDQYAASIADEVIELVDPHMPRIERASVSEEVDVAILGGGWAGILAGYHLRKMGVTGFRIVEQGGDFGGVWYWNRYPGLSCDNDSLCYLPLLEETHFVPSRKFADGREIREYCQSVARRFDLYTGALFHTRVEELGWDQDIQRWRVTTNRNDELRARFVVMANGPINTPKLPRIRGIEQFRGKMFHTARWDYTYTGGTQEEPVLEKLRDKRVAIVGTGASAIQAIPFLGKYCKQLYVLQRTPSTVDERRNTAIDPEMPLSLSPGWQRRRQYNFHKAAIEGLAPGEEDLVCDIWTEINRNLAAEFGESGAPHSIEEHMRRREVMDYRVMERLRGRVAASVRDRETAEILKPWYRHMCKRPASSDEFYPTFNRPNVRLFDVSRSKGVEALTRDGFIHQGHEYALDCLIFASGFEISSDLRKRWGMARIEGRGGDSLYDHWRLGFRTLHGTMTTGFPNQFFVGFYQGGFNATTTETFNLQCRHIAWIIGKVLERGITSVEPDPEAQRAYVKHLRDVAIDTSAFLRECTPGYFNNEGQEVEAEDGGKRQRSYAGEIYGPGFYAFEELLQAWRDKGDLRGLLLDGDAKESARLHARQTCGTG